MKKCKINYFKTRLHRILKYDCLQLGQKDHDTLENFKADSDRTRNSIAHFSEYESDFFIFHRIKSINANNVQNFTHFKVLQIMVTFVEKVAFDLL